MGDILNIFCDSLKVTPFKTSFDIKFVTTFQTFDCCEKLAIKVVERWFLILFSLIYLNT